MSERLAVFPEPRINTLELFPVQVQSALCEALKWCECEHPEQIIKA